MPEARPAGRPRALIWRLVLADLGHERLLSLCMVLAIASIMAPLLLLFGLKFGTIETMRQRLLDDPRNREIRPLSSRSYDQAWFERVRAWPETAFVVPYTRQISASLDAYTGEALAPPVTLEIVPTGPGDPWLASYGFEVPERGEGLLSRTAAETLGLGVGDRFTAAAKRLKGSEVERADVVLTVTGVFEDGGPVTRAVFVPLSFLEDVENYKDGRAVPELGWPGELPLARPVFTSLLIQMEEALDATLEFRLINNTGFTAVEALEPGRARDLTGRLDLPESRYYLLATKGAPARLDNLRTVTNLFRGKEAVFYPLADGLRLSLSPPDGSPGRELRLVPAAPLPAAAGQGPPEGRLDDDLSPDEWQKLLISGDVPAPEAMATYRGTAGSLTFPLATGAAPPGTAPGMALAPLKLLGTLAQADRRALIYEPSHRAFLLGRRAYAGFRLYARDLDEVTVLKKRLEAEGLSVATEAERIEEIRKLDRYLSLVFWLIAAGTVIGGAASLLSNIYAGLERKRRELGVLRLLGISGSAFLRFPLYSSLALTGGGFTVSGLLFKLLALTINYLFQDHLRPGESLCRLDPQHLLIALGLGLAISSVAGLAAAVRAAGIEPAEALRDE